MEKGKEEIPSPSIYTMLTPTHLYHRIFRKGAIYEMVFE